MRWAGCLLVVRRGGVLPGILPGTTVAGPAIMTAASVIAWSSQVRQWLAGAVSAGGAVVGTGVVLHILSGVLAGVVAWFQRFPGLGDVLRQDECATVPALHIHPAPGARTVWRIRVIPPFTDRGL